MASKKREVDKKVRDFFYLAFPTILIVILSMLFPVSESWGIAFIEIVIAVYQLIMLKQFLDNYHSFM